MRNFKNIGDVDNEIYCAKMLLNMEAMTGNNYAICNRMLELLIIYNKNKQYDEASKVLDMLIPRLHSIDEWYNTGIGRNALEQCMDIILHTEDLAEDLWEWSEPILKQIIEKCTEAYIIRHLLQLIRWVIFFLQKSFQINMMNLCHHLVNKY